MKQYLFGFVIVCALAGMVAAQVPSSFNQQGVLRNASTGNLTTGNFWFNLTVYNASDSEVVTTMQKYVRAQDGIYNVEWPGMDPYWFLQPTYFRLRIDNNSLLPRQNFTSVPYAMVSEIALNVSCEGITGAGYDVCVGDGGGGGAVDDDWINETGDTLTGDLVLDDTTAIRHDDGSPAIWFGDDGSVNVYLGG